MSGFKENYWNHFLNGGTSKYNFSYQTENNRSIEPSQYHNPVIVPSKAPEKVVIPTIKGGKRKSRRAIKKLRRTIKK